METSCSYAELEHKLQRMEARLDDQSETIKALRILVSFYEEKLHVAKRSQFGASNEQIPEQMKIEGLVGEIFNEAEDQSELKRPEPTYEEITYKRKKRVGKRGDDLSGLPVERVEYELTESERICPKCGDPMHDIGVTVRDEIVFIPARIIHKEHAVHAYACKLCNKESDSASIVRALAPRPLIAGSLATPSAVAHIAVQKYINGVPLYRQEKGFEYDNINLSRQTVSNWLVYCAQNYLAAIYSLLISQLKMEKYLHADETTVQVLNEPGRKAQTKSYEWLYRSGRSAGHNIVIYDYQETRGHEHPEEFLNGFNGYLHCDGYQGYHKLPENIIIIGCWAHVRRYWEKAYESVPEEKRDGSLAECGLAYTSLMFLLEDEYQDKPPDERLKLRIEFSKRVSDEFFKWVGELNVLPKSLLGEAVHYSLSQQKYLENIFLDGHLEISNNRAERSVKPFVQGRKQWLFSNTPNGAESSSIIYSILETAKENNLHPFYYMKFLLEKLPNTKYDNIVDLLPWSSKLPFECRVPARPVKPERKKKIERSLHQAIYRLRKKILIFQCPE